MYFWQFDYNMSIPQWNFLRLLSSEARQRFTYRCENSVGWEDANQDNYDKAVLLLAANDEIMTYGNAYITLIKDTCKVYVNFMLSGMEEIVVETAYEWRSQAFIFHG